MVETMDAHRGCGLAAPQVGKQLRVFVVRAHVDEEVSCEELARLSPRIFINPRLFDPSLEATCALEGCLSIPNVTANVTRPQSISVEYVDLEGRCHSERFEGFIARVIMHENDHLNGRLFVDRISAKDKTVVGKKLKSLKRRFAAAP